MGHKVHPMGFRLGVIQDWRAKWFAPKAAEYRAMLQDDIKIRDFIVKRYRDAAIAMVETDRGSNEMVATIHTARPGIVIGRGGQRVEELRQLLEGLVKKRVRLNIQEIRQPELNAYLVARNVADQIERRVSYRRAMKQAVSRTMQAGARGIRVHIAGRLGGAEIARREKEMEGRVPLHTIRADIDFAVAEAHTTLGRIGVKAWVYKRDVLPERTIPAAAEALPVTVTIGETEEPVAATQESQVSQSA